MIENYLSTSLSQIIEKSFLTTELRIATLYFSRWKTLGHGHDKGWDKDSDWGWGGDYKN